MKNYEDYVKFYNEKFTKKNKKETFEEFFFREDRGASQHYRKAVFYQEFLKNS
jgi:hypothetical protein